MPGTKKQEEHFLLRKLNLMDTTLLVIGAVLGSGIFMTTGFVADYLPSPAMIMIVFLTGGIITLSGALSFAELGAMFPKAGGQYVYLNEAYGPLAGFLYGWGFFWVIECGGIAALGVAFAEYLGYFFPYLSTEHSLISVNVYFFHYSLSSGQIIAVVSIIILSAVNYFGIKSGAAVQNIFTSLKILAVGALVVLGFALGTKSGAVNFSHLFGEGQGFSFKYFGLALIAVLWTYDGWYSVSCTAEEIKKPGRNIPLGLILGTAGVTLIYLSMNMVYLLALPVDKMKGIARIGEIASTQLFGAKATFFIAMIITISIFGCLSATIIYGPRVYYAMAKNRAFFRRMAYIHPRYRVPTKAIIGQAIWSSVLCLSGTFQALYEYVIFALVIFFAATGFAVVILRFRQPDKERPYKAWGYPLLPLLFVLINLFIFFNTIWAQPLKSLGGLVLLLLGIPAYVYWKAKKS